MSWPIPNKPWQGVFLINFVFEVGMILDSHTTLAIGGFIVFYLFCAPTFIVVYYVDKFLDSKLVFLPLRDSSKKKRKTRKQNRRRQVR
jgi:hypothetical protein